MDTTAAKVKAAKDEAKAQGKELDVYAVGVVTCRPTQKEAEEYYHYATIENGDWSAFDDILGKKNISVATVGEAEFQKQRHHYAHGMGGLLMVGDPDRIAQTLGVLPQAGLRAIGFSFVNYLKELPYFCAEVLPRLERMGIRQKRKSCGTTRASTEAPISASSSTKRCDGCPTRLRSSPCSAARSARPLTSSSIR